MQLQEEEKIRENITEYLKRHEAKDMLRFLTAGSVDDGKSTLIGRLLYDSQLIYEDQLAGVLNDSKVHGTTDEQFDPALLTDGLKAEREQGITIDVAYRYFSTDKRSFIICDAPGHEQYTRNMATGASHCNLAIILIDARHGVLPQTRRHSFICSLLGIKHFLVAVNKMDAVDYDKETFNKIKEDYKSFAAKLDVYDTHFIPISALKGDNVVNNSENMSWYSGSPLLTFLEEVQITSDRNLVDFRFPVQYVLRPHLNFRGYAGAITSGIIRKGENIIVLPSKQKTKVKSIVTFDKEVEEAFAPQSVVITTTDEVDISRGSIICRANNVPFYSSIFDANLVWMDENKILSENKRYLLKTNTQAVPCNISNLRYKFDINNLHRQDADSLELNDVGRAEVTTHRAISYDYYDHNKATGSFILIDEFTNATVAAGMIIEQAPTRPSRREVSEEPVSQNIHKEKAHVTPEDREKILGHRSATVWLTGLSGAGKSTIARALELKLSKMNINAFILDGDNIRHGLNKDLGFSNEDRKENIRRIAEVANLMNDAGVIVITSFISPFISERDNARELIGDNRFIEVFTEADLETCKERDPKGLYKKVEKGEIAEFTGIDSPYEEPQEPDVRLQTKVISIEDSVDRIIKELQDKEIIK